MIKISAVLFVLSLHAAAQRSPLVPETWFQDLTAADGSVQQSVVFTTVPGVEYTFYHSDNLDVWAEVGKTYGLGHDFAAAMREVTPAPPPPDPQNPPAAPADLINASITIQSSSAIEGGTLVSWPSLDHGNAVRYLVTEDMAQEWDAVPLFVGSSTNYQFFISHPTGTIAPPDHNPLLQPLDAAMIAEFDTALPTFNATVTSSTIIARSTPPLPMPAPEGKGFWRIKADWSKDSDNDGIRDHTEYAMAAAAEQGGQSGGGGTGGSPATPDPFNNDTNGNGTPDGEELDSDGDGTPDDFDIAGDDGNIAFQTIALPRYAMFPLEEDPSLDPLAINDRGTVLYPDRVWKAGSFFNLKTLNHGIPATGTLTASAINDFDEILGNGPSALEIDPYGADHVFRSLCHWNFPGLEPARVSLTSGNTTFAEYRDKFHGGQNNVTGNLLDNSGTFFSESFEWDDTAKTATSKGWKKWKLPRNTAGLSHAATGEWQTHLTEDASWGTVLDTDGVVLSHRVFSPFEAEVPFLPRNLLKLPPVANEVVPYLATPGTIDVQALIRKGDAWQPAGIFSRVTDMTADGTAIGGHELSARHAPILLNGRWFDIERHTPDLPQAWTAGRHTFLYDTTPGGWILASNSQTEATAALLPLRVEGSFVNSASQTVTRAVGVDDFSIGRIDGPTAGPPVAIDPDNERIWIMAPLGGPEKTVKFRAPVHATAPVVIGADGILLSGGAEVTLNGPETTFSVKAGPGAVSGKEKLLDIKMGTAQSVSKPIGFKIMKRREVKVAVWIVRSDRNPPGMLPTDPEYQNIVDTDFNPTEAELNNYLNNVFDPQINAVFDCKVNHIDVRFDTATGTAFGAPAEDVKAPNWTLDTDLALGKEFDPIRLAGYDDTKSINLYIVSANFIGINTWLPHSNYLHRSINWGKASRTQRIVVVAGGWPRTSFGYFDTVAHEIGHILIGPGHPDENTGPAPLPGTRDIERLMCSGGKKRLEGHLSLLVKKEWHEADLWLTGEENDGRIGP